MNIRNIIKHAVDIIYPPRCPICETIVKDDMACDKCKSLLKYVGDTYCLKCGKKLDNSTREFCSDCIKLNHTFDYGVSVFEYDDGIKNSIYRFKYKNRRIYAKFYASEIVRVRGQAIRRMNPQVIVPVPMYIVKERVRGYNQAELVAKELSKLLGIPCDSEYLIRNRKTIPQKELNDKERISNVKNAFQIGKSGVKYSKVLLVDDIYTTGITMDECTRVLRANGADKVYFVTVCIGKGF